MLIKMLIFSQLLLRLSDVFSSFYFMASSLVAATAAGTWPGTTKYRPRRGSFNKSLQLCVETHNLAAFSQPPAVPALHCMSANVEDAPQLI